MKRLLSLPFRLALRFYLWLWNEDAATEPNADIHRKIIWELRNAIKQIEK